MSAVIPEIRWFAALKKKKKSVGSYFMIDDSVLGPSGGDPQV